jgi:hypothetical protein
MSTNIEKIEVEEIVDYAMPLMRIDKLARQIHDDCLHGNLARAEEMAVHLIAEGRILRNSLVIMQSRNAR